MLDQTTIEIQKLRSLIAVLEYAVSKGELDEQFAADTITELKGTVIELETPNLPSHPVMLWRFLRAIPKMARIGYRYSLWNIEQPGVVGMLNNPLFRNDTLDVLRLIFREWTDEQIEHWCKKDSQ